MKIISSNELNRLAEKLSVEIAIDDLLIDYGISYINLCLNELCSDDPEKAFEFGHKYWGKNVVVFHYGCFCCHCVGTVKQIKKIMEKELKEIEKEE